MRIMIIGGDTVINRFLLALLFCCSGVIALRYGTVGLLYDTRSDLFIMFVIKPSVVPSVVKLLVFSSVLLPSFACVFPTLRACSLDLAAWWTHPYSFAGARFFFFNHRTATRTKLHQQEHEKPPRHPIVFRCFRKVHTYSKELFASRHRAIAQSIH